MQGTLPLPQSNTIQNIAEKFLTLTVVVITRFDMHCKDALSIFSLPVTMHPKALSKPEHV